MPKPDLSAHGARLTLLISSLLFFAACGLRTTPVDEGDTESIHSDLVVSAAASLTDAFAEIESLFETANPDVDVILNLGSTSSLRQQIIEGAPVDVYASADISNMDQVVEAGETAEFEIFARNRLQIAVPAGNPAGIVGLEDFGDEDLVIGLCAEDVPCGALGRAVLAIAGVTPSIDTSEPDVRALLTKIEAGELDAGITYLTDVLSTSGVEGLDIPDGVNLVADYPIAALANAPNPGAASAFVSFVLSEQGQAILNRYGFSSP